MSGVIQRARERRFNPARVPLTSYGHELVRWALEYVAAAEQRRRRRTQAAEALHRDAVSALVSDLAYCLIDGANERLTVELSKQRLGPKQRRAPFMTEAFADVVRLMAREDVAMVDLTLGTRTPFGNVRSTIAPGSALRETIDRLGLRYEDFSRNRQHSGPPVVLRGPKRAVNVGEKVERRAEELPLPDTPEAKALVAEMEAINDWIAEADIDWGGERRIDLGNRHLRRIFNNGSLREGGRLYGGFWQQLTTSQRLGGIWIEQSNVVQLDFAQFGLHIAYAEVGVEPPPGDLYEIPGYQSWRSEVKAIINALLCADHLPRRFPPGTRGGIPKSRSFANVLEDITRKHGAVAKLFGTSAAMRTMYLESQMLVRALLRLQAQRIVALPIHDCLLVGRGDHHAAQLAMEEACLEVAGVSVAVETEAEGSHPSADN